MTSTAMEQDVCTMEIRKEVLIDASIELSFDAMLEEIGPNSVLPDGKPFALTLEPWPGGRWYRDLGNNAGHLWGHVQVIKPPALLEIVGPMPMSFPAVNHVQYRFKEENGKTRLSFVHKAMGLLTQELRDGMPEGWEEWLGRIKQNAEQKKSQKGSHR